MTDENTDTTPIEPPPFGRAPFSGMTLDAVPFGSPPLAAVVIEGDVPWELQDDEPAGNAPTGNE